MSNGTPAADLHAAAAIDTSTPHPARRYDHWLGGKDNFAADRASGAAIAAAFPHIRTAVVENRRFLHRAVSYLAEDAGICQFLDLGTGIPTQPNTHEIAQQHRPDAHVVYVDNDPVVLVHARALLVSGGHGNISYLDADIRDTEGVLASAAELLDFTRPVAVLSVAAFHFILDADHPRGVLRAYLDALPRGSYLAFSHATLDDQLDEVTSKLASIPSEQLGDFQPRTHAEVAEFLTGLEVLQPGIVPTSEWRPEPGVTPVPLTQAAAWSAVARVP